MKSLSELCKSAATFNELRNFLATLSTRFSTSLNDEAFLATNAAGEWKIMLWSECPENIAMKLDKSFFSFELKEKAVVITHIDPTALIPDCFEAVKSISHLFAMPKDNLKKVFVVLYQNELKADMQNESEKNKIISKCASLALVDKLEKENSYGKLKLSYIGRSGTKIDAAHKVLLPFSSDYFKNRTAVSRLHCVFIENDKNDRILIDLGSTYGTTIKFNESVDKEKFLSASDWAKELFTCAKGFLTEKNDEYQALCPNYKEVIKEAQIFLDNSLKDKNEADNSYQLVTDEKGIGWMPIPQDANLTIQIGDHVLDLLEEACSINKPNA